MLNLQTMIRSETALKLNLANAGFEDIFLSPIDTKIGRDHIIEELNELYSSSTQTT